MLQPGGREPLGARIVRPFVQLVEKYLPDAFIFAALLTMVAFVMALGLTDAGFMKTLTAWGDGFRNLMAFIGQIAFTLVSSVALANTRPVRALLRRLAGLAASDSAAYALVTFVSAVASWISWAFGLAIGGLIARQVAINLRDRGIRAHYPLLVASAYSGFVIWHMGYSGSAQLFVATKGHAMEKMIGILPVTQTIFAGYNLIGAVIIAVTLPFLMSMLKPREQDMRPLPDHVRDGEEEAAVTRALKLTPAQWLEQQRWINLVLGLGLAAYLVQHFANKGLDLNLDIVNWTFLTAGLLLSRSPIEYVDLVARGSSTVGQIILQYPFYAGIMGLMVGTGLAKVIAGWFVAISTAKTLPFWGFIAGGVINMFIPSGGGQWSVQGPIFLEAARQLGTAPHFIVNAVAYGDQWTNMIQPFWTIPILSIAGLHVREVVGYTFVTLIYTGIVLGAVLLIAA